jgi:hypothetical protein
MSQLTINRNVSKEDAQLITEICRQYEQICRDENNGKLPKGYQRINLDMDLTACHLNGCPLDLEKLVAFDDFNLTHDVEGISAHIDRNTGKLTRCFLPRSAKPTEVSA